MSVADKSVRTIADIARLAGVSKSTVSRALSDSPLISQQTKDRIQAIAREYKFQVHQPARRLSLKQSQTIAFVTKVDLKHLDFLMDPFHLEIQGAIVAALATYNHDLLVAHVEPDDFNWPHRYLDAGRVDGFILLNCSQKAKYIRILVDIQSPFIVWGVPLPQHSYCSVSGDDLTGGRLAVQHLIQSGRQRIAFLGGSSPDLEVQLRYRGYEMALQEAGRTVDPALVAYGDYTSKSGSEVIQRLRDQAPDLDAVFVNSDVMAIAAMRTLREQGCRIPEDVAVVGYDDISLAMHCDPPLTTIRQNIQEAGRLLVQNLMQYLETGIVTNVTMPVELVVRKSSVAQAF
jgi:DNA-binding LacI/PurR family transcriptional regulator